MPSKRSDTGASDKSSGIGPVPMFSDDGGPTHPDGEMSLPTPTANPGRNRTSGRQERSEHHDGVTLADWAWMASSEGVMPPEVPTSSSEASRDRVNRSQPPDAEGASPTNAIFGPSSRGASTPFDPRWWRSRTSRVCYLSDAGWMTDQQVLDGITPSGTFSETWPRWGSMRGGVVYAHPTPERVTNASGSSSLHTPTTGTPREAEYGPDGKPRYLLPQLLALFPTPTTGDVHPAYDGRSSSGQTRPRPVPNLAATVQDVLLPTPRTPTGGPEPVEMRRARGNIHGHTLEATIGSLGDPTGEGSNDGEE